MQTLVDKILIEAEGVKDTNTLELLKQIEGDTDKVASANYNDDYINKDYEERYNRLPGKKSLKEYSKHQYE
jgi:hypothetical protein